MESNFIELLKECFDKAPEDAVNFLESKGIEISWDWKEQLKIIREHAFTVSKVSSADVLQMLHDELKKAMNKGTTYRDFKKHVNPLLVQKGYRTKDDGSAWRLDVIYRTNMQGAYMGGRYAQMLDVKDEFPYWQYIAVLDNRTRPNHRALNDKVVKNTDKLWHTHFPPNGYNCRCRVRALTLDDVKAKGLTVGKGSRLKKFKPDKGFETYPGEKWKPQISGYFPDLRKLVKHELATTEE
jgi:SPP1 gp7 family putative phage head morphogenesis protein